jgi:hypothetical protein
LYHACVFENLKFTSINFTLNPPFPKRCGGRYVSLNLSHYLSVFEQYPAKERVDVSAADDVTYADFLFVRFQVISTTTVQPQRFFVLLRYRVIWC